MGGWDEVDTVRWQQGKKFFWRGPYYFLFDGLYRSQPHKVVLKRKRRFVAFQNFCPIQKILSIDEVVSDWKKIRKSFFSEKYFSRWKIFEHFSLISFTKIEKIEHFRVSKISIFQNFRFFRFFVKDPNENVSKFFHLGFIIPALNMGGLLNSGFMCSGYGNGEAG